ncbi:hypothetical protein BGAL_0518g00020 [Botrytis galanthina]|uniref:Uncharacterized protein n=1 Tax=Botrytis galanthina TaxID=278940 RepID=A0A4S8QNI6_9HELO|nr:hypothetical protein BGAL_0518g00020 [Botrytis galanthina]
MLRICNEQEADRPANDTEKNRAIEPFILKKSLYNISSSRRLRPSVVECLMLLVVTPSVEGDVKNAGMTRADAIDAKITAMRMVMRILAVVCDVAYLFQKVDL